MSSTELHDKILLHLRRLIRRSECVLSYDFDLVDALPQILREQHGVIDDTQIHGNSDLAAIFELLAPTTAQSAWAIADIPSLLRSSNVPLDEFSTRTPEGLTGQAPATFDKWTTTRANEEVGDVLALQKDLGMGRWNAQMQKYESNRPQTELKDYLRNITTAPPSFIERILRKPFWEFKFAWWKLNGTLQASRRSLSIGPRWVTEIAYFREIVGLPQHIGLDLFSDDPELVVSGDMHAMPFPDDEFHFIFLKNTADKSYDIRKLVAELLRVIAPGGLIVIDQICGYGRCSPLSRTDIQKARNLLTLFEARARVKPLVCYDVDVSGIGDARERNEVRRNARLALQVVESSP